MLLLCLALLGAVAADSASTSAGPLAPSDKYAHGLLWRIETDRAAPSYLFGTLHSDDPRVTALPNQVRDSFDRARSFTMEMVADDAAVATMAAFMFFNDGRTLPGILGDALYAETRKVLAAEGLPQTGLERQKPWVVVVMLSTPRPRDGVFLDLALQARAQAQSKPIHGLETVAEQLSIFDDLPMADQIALLKDTLRLQPQARALLEEITRAYLARNLARMMTLADKHRPADARVYDALMKRLITQRNVRMASRMRARLAEGNAFIAVGAAHLPGPDGLLNLLERAGYRVSSVY